MLLIPFYIHSMTGFEPMPSPGLRNVPQGASLRAISCPSTSRCPSPGVGRQVLQALKKDYFQGLPLHCPIPVFIHSPIHDDETLTHAGNQLVLLLLRWNRGTRICVSWTLRTDGVSIAHAAPAKVSGAVKSLFKGRTQSLQTHAPERQGRHHSPGISLAISFFPVLLK